LQQIFGADSSYLIKIVDLGNACWITKKFSDDVQTREYRAPEVIIGGTYGTAIDVWSVACIVFELLTGDQLFQPKAGREYAKSDDHLALMIELIGKPKPNAIAGKWVDEYFTRKGDLRKIRTFKLKFWGLKEVLIEKYHFSEDESISICDFVLPMLRFNPSERTTAKESLSNPWIKNIGIENFETAF